MSKLHDSISSFADGDTLLDAASLVELLRWRALRQPGRVAYTFLPDGDAEEINLTYGELDRQARAIGAWLQPLVTTGERVLLLYPPGLEYIAAFFGCLYAGAVAVPAYPPRRNRGLLRLQAIVADAQATVALTTGSILSKVAPFFSQNSYLEPLRWLTTESVADGAEDSWQEPVITGADLAFLQYTSGSTAVPKGVMIRHGNLLHNEQLIQREFKQTEESLIVGWLPLYHDMGLIGNVIQPLYVGARCVLMSPVLFLQRPVRWLQAITRYRATTSGGPNFAYDLCARKVTEEQRAQLDLSSWQVAFNGAEPIRHETLERFAAAFAPCGFRREAFYPCYGLAEATLLVSGGQASSHLGSKAFQARALERNSVIEAVGDEDGADVRSLVSCGSILPEQQVAIVDPESQSECLPGSVGEIWVAGQSVAQGYWNNPEETEQTFGARLAESGAGPFLRTGDWGFIHDGELFVTGRLKDLIIIRGLNHYPQDIEMTVEKCHASLRPNACAAFSVEAGGEERLVIVQEVDHRRALDFDSVIKAIREAVADEHEVQAHGVVLIRAGSIHKTSSGKIQRRACRAAYLERSLDALAEWHARVSAVIEQQALAPTNPVSQSAEAIEQWLQLQLASRLGVDAGEIAVDQPLMRYGLDSLTAIELIHEVEVKLGACLPIVSLLQSPSIAELATVVQAQLATVTAAETTLAPAQEAAEQVTPLSWGQQALWFLQRLAPESSAYNIVSALRVRADLDTAALRRSFQGLVDRHPLLRATFTTLDGRPVQRTHEHVEVYFQEEDASLWSEEFLKARLWDEANRPFDLEHGPLLRVHLFRQWAGEHVLLLVVHHIVADFWSLAVCLHELGILYQSEKNGTPATLPHIVLQYADYVRWQEELLASPEGERLQAYWLMQLSGELPALNLPVDRPRPPAQTYRGASHSFTLGGELTESLKAIGQANGATLYMTLLAAWQTLLSRYTNQEDITVGSPTAGRSWAALSGIVGYFVNPVVLRADLFGNPTFEEFLGRVRQTVLAAFENQDYPFPMLVERLQPERDPSRSPLFQVMFTLQKAHLLKDEGLSALALSEMGARVRLGELELESIALEHRVAQFDLSLVMAETSDGVTASLQYNTDLFDAATITRLAGHFQTLLSAVATNSGRHLSELPLLTEHEERELLVRWNETTADFAGDSLVHELFEAQAERTPDAVAVVFAEQQLSYRELNRRVNQLAHHLRSAGVRPESRVGIMMERSLEMVVGLLGILKAGGAYVPLDPEYPSERLQFMLKDAQLLGVITQQRLLHQLPERGGLVLCLDSDWHAIAQESEDNPASEAFADNLAYVLYTSGSTGLPKGAMIPHRALRNHMLWMQAAFPLTAEDCVLQKTPISFDASVWEFYAPLLAGARLFMARPGGHQDAAYLCRVIAQHQITTLQLVPTLLRVLLQEEGIKHCHSLKRVFCGGEALTPDLVQNLLMILDVELTNLYGPTETTIEISSWSCRRGNETQVIPVGRPICNTQIYILDSHLQPLPVGLVGELHISGESLGRGYFDRSDLTAERFIPHPFSREAGARLYRTGDLARYLPGGEIEFIGRVDEQVKVRGYRIELGEIEAVLKQHESVTEAVVSLREDEPGAKRLVAYCVAVDGQQPTSSQLREHLRTKLPGYMIPSSFVLLDALPLTPSGKLDRRALPAPGQSRSDSQSGYVAPSTATEELLASIWSGVLKVERVGVHDNFFELGGHSLLATQLVSRIRETLRVELPLRSLFESQTIVEQSRLVEQLMRDGEGLEAAPIATASREQPLPLSFAQQRLWFLDQLEPQSSAYNIPAAVRLRGPLLLSALERSLSEIIRRHKVLRTNFAIADGQPVQVISPPEPLHVDVIDLSHLAEAERETEAERMAEAEAAQPFNLSEGPLLRARLLRLSAEEHILLLTMHHIISDGWSMGVLVREVSALYAAFSGDQVSPLPELQIQYADYAVWQREQLQGETLERQLDYWREQLTDAPQVLELPTDRPRPAVQSHRGSSTSFLLDRELTEQLRQLSREQNVTLFMTLLSAFQALLYRYSNQSDILVGTPIANRTRSETESLIGFFVNTLVLRGRLSSELSFREMLEQTRDVTLGAYAHQEIPFERVVEELQPERSLSHAPLFQVMFILQNVPHGQPGLVGLEMQVLESKSATTKFDLTVAVEESAKGELTGRVEYSAELFEAETIRRMVSHFEQVLRAVAAKPEQSISEIELLSAAERKQIVEEWNETAREYPQDKRIHELFEEQAERTPDALALVFAEQQLSYRELNHKANQLAHYLRELGVGPEDKVGIFMPRSLEMIVSVLGVLKAGGAYLPLDPEYPQERLSFMLRDADVKVLLTEQQLLEQLPPSEAAIVTVKQCEELAQYSGDNLGSKINGENLAYVIYTSGSTGQPKGVCLQHSNAVAFLTWAASAFEREHTSLLLFCTSLCFDLSIFELFTPLVTGGTVLIVKDALALSEAGGALRPTLINTVASAAQALLEAQALPETAKIINLAGEPLRRALVERLQAALPESRIYNLYGPTEYTTYSTYCEVEAGASSKVTVGRPVANTQVYILDKWLEPVPIGVVGEIHIAGAGLTRGYLSRAELTAERFIPNPFAGPGDRMYRTGDLGRYLEDGQIEYLGRNDHQVKVRGYRIELGEVEAALTGQAGVKEAVVIVSEDERGEKQLVAYVVAEAGGEFSATNARSHLQEQLPTYMLPSMFVLLDELPLTPNGKVDRKALPAPELSRSESEDGYVAPRTPTEELLASIWGEVLRVERVGVRGNFFELGGHSLLATQLVSRVRGAFHVELPLHSLFERPTIAGQAQAVEEHSRAVATAPLPGIVAAPREQPLPLSFAQQRLWFLDQLEPQSSAYNIPAAVRLRGELHVDALEGALNEVIRRHEVLRTSFIMADGQPVQVIAQELRLEFPITDLSYLAGTERGAEVARVATVEAQQPFDLSHGPLLRAQLLRLTEQEHVLLLTMHHIISDGWSMGVLIREVSTLYAAFSADQPSPLTELPIQYADYAVWQREQLQGEALEQQLQYWREHLKDAPQVLELPTDRPRPVVQSYRGAAESFTLNRELTEQLRQLSREQNVTLFMTLLSAFQALLYRYSGQNDVLVGTPIANRTRAETEDLIGFFVNTLVLRGRFSEKMTFRELLRQAREVALGAYAHQDVPFERLIEDLQVERSLSHAPLFQIMFALQNVPHEQPILADLEIQVLEGESATTKFDLMVTMQESARGELEGRVEHSTELFDAATIKRMLSHYEQVLRAVAVDAQQKVSAIELLSAVEREQMLVQWNETSGEYRKDKCVHELFEEQVERTPDAIAVVFGEQQVSYRELNQRANQLAHYLRRLGFGENSLVGVCMERSVEMVVGLLGVLKAGGAYVPIDLEYPRERLRYMLNDAQIAVLLTQQRLVESLPELTARVICLDSEGLAAEESELNPASVVSPASLAYVIYTSGSTGQPKGVMIPHRSLVNHMCWMLRTFPLTVDDTILQKTPISFDASVWEFYAPLLTGARLVMALPAGHASSAYLVQAIAAHEVTTLQLVPSMLRVLLQESGLERCQSLRRMFCGGEALAVELEEQFFNSLTAELHNLYGPTEACIDATFWTCQRGDRRQSIPIGRPIANMQTYILDERMEPVPVGAKGELYIGGDGLGRGYLNRAALTAERFVPNPFGSMPGGRLYRTGDIARYLPDGNIEYLGRVDEQVKVRGYRIELGEIESALSQHRAIREAAVVVREVIPGEKHLVAYVVTDDERRLTAREMRSYLQEQLPLYMLPSTFVLLDKLPLTPSGKLDRRSLPAPALTRSELEDSYVAPGTATEELLASIWSEVLRAEKISIHDNFFELGGHSLLATQLISRIRETLRVELPLRSLFEHPTIAEQAQAVEGRLRAAASATLTGIVPVPRNQPLPLSFAQQRLWFLDQLEPQSNAYNIPAAVRLDGMLDFPALDAAINEVVCRHEVLRTSFVLADSQPVQVIAPELRLALTITDLMHLTEDEREAEVARVMTAEAAQPFDLPAGPLLRVRLLCLSSEEHVLLLTMHHIISDGWSMGVLIREVSALYAAFSDEQVSPLPPLPIQYADYALWQREQLQGEVLERQLSYWREQLMAAPQVLELPTDRPRPAVQSFRGAVETFLLNRELTEDLKQLSREQKVTLFMTLLSAFQTLLYRYSGQEDILVGTPIANRTHRETEDLIGFFVNTLVLRGRLSSELSFRELLEQTREVALGAYAHQELPFERLVEELQPERSLNHTPLFQVMFALQNAPHEQQNLSGLKLEVMNSQGETAKFDLTVAVEEGAEGELEGRVEYSTELFDAATIKRMLSHYEQVLRAVAADAEQRISTIELLSAVERRQILEEWNETTTDYPQDKSVHELFEEQVERTPDALAVVFEGQQLSYRELNRRANQLAHYLRELEVGPEALVGILMNRSVEMLTAVLAVLKAGGAYVPLDPEYPQERLSFMLRDADMKVLLTQRQLAESLPELEPPVICVDEARAFVARQSTENPSVPLFAENPAYVIYTSGSTGRPKGVIMCHGSLSNLIRWQLRTSLRSGKARTLQFASLSFDVSFQEIFSTWCAGATLVLISEQARREALELSTFLKEEAIERLFLPVVALQQLAEVADEQGEIPEGLHEIITAGEQLKITRQVRSLFDKFGGCKLHNHYGPSESHVVTAYMMEGSPDSWVELPPIGQPITNTQIYLLDKNLQPVPIGVTGELYLGGIGLSRGYLKRPELTAERFIPHPFSGKAGARLYRTGDLARYLPDGNIAFLGRSDHQVKVRGYRIELGEVETVLIAFPSVKEAVVVALDDGAGAKRLVAYVVVDAEHSSTSDIRSHLREQLPSYMIPSSFVLLDALPLTPSGKLDRRALPPPQLFAAETEHSFVAPRTEVEQLLAGLWQRVLRIEQVGRHDNFFELGGHSLLATQLVSRMREAFQVELPVRSLFEHPTVVALAAAVERHLRGTEARPQPGITPVDKAQPLPLSFAQQRLWFLEQLEPGSALYNIPLALRLRGPLLIGALEKTLSEIIRRHEVLRTSFIMADGQPVQVISEAEPFSLAVTDLSDLAEGERESEVGRAATVEAQQPFDLSHSPLLRARLLRLSGEEHVLLLSMHHIISDGWSMGVLVKEVSALYAAFSRNQPSPLEELPIQYADYAVWQREQLQGETLEQQLSYWREQLKDAPQVLELPADRPRPAVQSYRGSSTSFLFDRELLGQLKQLSKEQNVTLFMTLLSAFQTLLYRYSNQSDILVGTPIANRTRAETEDLIGFFVNTLVLRGRLSSGITFRELLEQTREVTLGAYAHQELPFERLVEELQPERSLSHTPLFQVMFTLQNAPRGAAQLEGLQLEMLEGESATTKFDLTVAVEEGTEGELEGRVEYNGKLFEAETIKRMISHFEQVLRAIVADSEQAVAKIELLTLAERKQILQEWNETAREYPQDKCLHELFEEQVERTPDAIAVVFGGQQLSYRELNQRANQLAHYLRELGVGPEDKVGILMDRSVEMVVGLLGVLKAGGAYMPIDPEYPQKRLSFMLEDACASVLLTQAHLKEKLPEHGAQVLCLDVDRPAIEPLPVTNPAKNTLPLNLAYVIYTSGSTGQPKGVCLQHSNAVAFLTWAASAFEREHTSLLLFCTSLCFDLSIFELFTPLVTGGTVLIVKDALALSEAGGALRPTLINTVASAAQALLEAQALPETAKIINLAGEPLRRALVERLQAALPESRIYNLYGPTEYTTYSTYCEVEAGASSKVTVGRPVANTQVYILDKWLEPVPIGVVGEIHIAGAGLTRGYLSRAELTAERFIPNPFAGPGDRMYRTGDLGRYLEDGQIEYLGRNDHQVKVRGYRIELGEVEAALTGQAGVKEAVVIVSEDERGEKQLVAYVVASDEQLARSNELGERLRAKLPAYMLPSAFILLDKLPLTPNGKVDRKALPAPMRGRAEASSSYIAPRTATEELLASIWGEVLRVERVGVRGNFFELGGHSLLATQLVSRVRGAFHVELPLRSLFESPTIVEQSRLVGQLMRDGEGLEAAPIVAAQREQPLPLSFAQQRLWFLDQLEPGSALYNIPLALRLRGALDRTALSTALNEVIRRHEVLRTSFVITDDQPVQVITATMHLTLPVTDLSDLSESEREAEVKRIAADEAAQPFDLSAGPLLHARLLRLNVEEHVVLLTMHHIISDGWSMGVLVREVSALYAAFSSGQPSPLPELQIQYADYALWQREQLQCEVLERQLSYWREQMQGAPQVLELPTDRPRPSVQNYRGSSISFLLDHELAEQLRQLSREQNVTLFMTLLASFQTLLSRYSGQNDVLVGTPIANRTHRETEDLIGFFVNTLVLRNRFTSELNFRELLEQTREVTLGAYAHQELPFERLVEELQPERSLSHTPLFQVMFTLQNTPREQPNLTGLEMEVLDGGSETAKFELSLSVTEVEEGLAGAINYRTELFEAATIERMIAHYERLLRAIVVKPGQSVSSIELLSAAEREQMLVGWNETTAGYPQEKCIHELFEEQVERTPDALAIVFGEQQLSYRELNQRANQLAHYLRQLGVAPEDRVGILMPRSIEMVVSVLAVLKAGGAYVPLDPEYPQERLCFMIRDASASVLLTHSQLTEHLPQSDAVLIAVERCEELSRQSTENLARTSKPSNLAYVIYTSGSTGTPKGVMIEQQSLVNYLCWATSAYRLSEAQGAPLHSSLSFDLSVTSLFTPLLAGRPVHLLAEGLEALEQTLESGPQYSLVKLTPAHLEVLGRSLSDENAPGQTRALIVGGESLSGESLTYWREHSPQTVVVNEYGPTETVVGCCVYARRAAEINHGAVPIGRPIANTELYILDERMEPVAVGVRGELYIGGRGVGRGYLNRPELTAERFLPHPFSAEPGARLYRTGDIARYLEDGNIEFIGRIDEQVKVRGYRIELGEIEAVLAQHSAIREAVTAVREGIEEEKHLAAYVVAANGQQLTSSELRSYLQERLPAYMVPSAFVQLDELPLTLNGKVDRRALPAPEQSRVGSEVSYVAPKTATEELLTLIWGEVLRVERVGVDDNFFELGGHSLLVVKVRGRLREVLQREISIADMFRYPTIKSLARHLDHGQSEDTSLHGTQDRARKQREAINRQRRQLKGRKSRG